VGYILRTHKYWDPQYTNLFAWATQRPRFVHPWVQHPPYTRNFAVFGEDDRSWGFLSLWGCDLSTLKVTSCCLETWRSGYVWRSRIPEGKDLWLSLWKPQTSHDHTWGGSGVFGKVQSKRSFDEDTSGWECHWVVSFRFVWSGGDLLNDFPTLRGLKSSYTVELDSGKVTCRGFCGKWLWFFCITHVIRVEGPKKIQTFHGNWFLHQDSNGVRSGHRV